MFIINLTDPLTLILLLTATVLSIILGKETKKPIAPAIALTVFLALVLMHSIQLSILPQVVQEVDLQPYKSALIGSIGFDCALIFISFFGYLWIDDISSKFYKKKSIDNSLDWFWNKI